MPAVLQEILDNTRQEVLAAKRERSAVDLASHLTGAPPPRPFVAPLRDGREGDRSTIIAEVKRRSPSGGEICRDFDPVAIATAYEKGGATAISCLTDQKYFGGSLAFLTAIRAAVDLPVLRKDFLIDPWQLLEARVAGADAVLLIAEVLPPPLAGEMLAGAIELGMACLLEIHDADNAAWAWDLVAACPDGTAMLGINNRDLLTMTTDLAHTLRVVSDLPSTDLLVSESGIQTAADLATLRAGGVATALVGESLMRRDDPGEALQELLSPYNPAP
jgi:indole-3-glycerol phosphate synthase